MTGTDNSNPGNFANRYFPASVTTKNFTNTSRPKEEVQEIASKGGRSSHSGGFASMDAEKQVGPPDSRHFNANTNIVEAENCFQWWQGLILLFRVMQ